MSKQGFVKECQNRLLDPIQINAQAAKHAIPINTARKYYNLLCLPDSDAPLDNNTKDGQCTSDDSNLEIFKRTCNSYSESLFKNPKHLVGCINWYTK